MGNHEWDDDKIEQLLSNAPKIKDERSKEDILAKLKSDPRLTGPEKKKNLQKWMPASISAAAIVTLAVLVSSFNSGSHSGQREVSVEDSAADMPESAEMKTFNNDSTPTSGIAEEENDISYQMTIGAQPHLAVYPADLEAGYREFHLGVSSQGEPIPVTFLISNAKIEEDFGNVEVGELELYRKYADVINENAFGFSEYHPMAGEFKEEDGLVIHVLPENHNYDLGGSSTSTYFNTLISTFYDYKELKVVNKDGSPAEFSEIGTLDTIELPKGKIEKTYYLFTIENGQIILAPWYWADPADLDTALMEMKDNPSDLYRTAIPENINFKVSEQSDVAEVTFTETVDLLSMDPSEAQRMIEGMLLTGASFGKQIQFHNVMPKEWNGFDFTQPLPMPIGPNRFLLE